MNCVANPAMLFLQSVICSLPALFLLQFGLQKSLDGDKELVSNFLSTMLETGCDFTNGFRSLSLVTLPESAQLEESKHKFLDNIVKECASLTELQKFYKPKIPPGYVFRRLSLN